MKHNDSTFFGIPEKDLIEYYTAYTLLCEIKGHDEVDKILKEVRLKKRYNELKDKIAKLEYEIKSNQDSLKQARQDRDFIREKLEDLFSDSKT